MQKQSSCNKNKNCLKEQKVVCDKSRYCAVSAAPKMYSALLLCTIMVSTMAAPNGFYHQEYNYQTSSSSFKNNELQHKNDDEGYYSKDGDLQGRFRPRVNAHSQHSEYVNPKLQHAYRIGTDRSASYGQLNAQNGYRMGDGAYGGEMGGAYGLQQNYGVDSDLRQVTTSLQSQMEREVQRAVFEHHQRAAAYGVVNQAQVETDRRILEEELRRNMTMRLQEALKTQYGNQGIRGAYSYSIINGRLQPAANYNNQELEDLRRQLETRLLSHLEQQVQTQYQTRVDTQVHQRNGYQQVNGHDSYPSGIQHRPMIYPQPQPMIQPQPQPQLHPHPHPVALVPDSITTVATRVQTELNEILNKILEDTQRRYFAENSYNSGVNYDAVLAQLQEELRTNVTFHFDDQIKRAYGYSNYASNYRTEDIQNLRRQIETNLVTKLNRDFNKQREKFFQGRRMYVVQPIIPGNQAYYPVQNTNYQRNIADMQRQLQEQMSSQLQTALTQQSSRQAHMYTNTGAQYNPQVQYQDTLNQLSAELNRNLTRQMELLNVQHQDHMRSEAYDAQMVQMRNQLQHDLQRQLQQGLQQSFSRHSSWSSASSSSSSNANYRPVRGYDHSQNGVYGGSSDVMGEDCMMGDDPSVYQQQDDDLTQQVETLDQDLTQQTQTHGFLIQHAEERDLTQQAEEQHLTQQVQTHDDLTQQVEDLTQNVQTHDNLIQQAEERDLTQQAEEQDLTQQVQTHDALTQQVRDQDLTQQVQTHDDLTQQVEAQDFTQQSQGDVDLTQQVQSHDDLTQQVQTHDDLTQQVQTHDDLTQQAQTRDDLTQQVQGHDNLFQQSQTDLRTQPNQIYRSSPYSRPGLSQNQNLESQQQAQNADHNRESFRQPLNQQSQTEQVLAVEPVYSTRNVNQLYSHQRPRQELPAVDQTQQGQPIRQSPVEYQVYRRRYIVAQPLSQQNQVVDTPYQQQTFTQTSPNVNQQQQRYQTTRYEASPQYTSTYEWKPQARTPPGNRVGQTVQFYENLERQRNTQSPGISRNTHFQRQQPYGPNSIQRQDLLGQQTETDDLTQQTQGQHQLLEPIQQVSNQQSQDLTQQTQHNQDSEFAPLQIGNNRQAHEKDNFYYRRYSPKPSQVESLSQQNQNINHQNHANQPNQQTQDLTQQTEDLTQTQDLTQQSQDLTQQTQDLTKPNQHLNQQSQDLSQQNQDLTQQTEDLDQQFQDLTQQSQDLTHQKPTPVQQSQNLRVPTQYANQQSQNLRVPTQYANQQSQILRVPTQYAYQQSQNLDQQTEDLDQQTQDLTQKSQDLRISSNQTQDNQDLTQQTEDLTQQFEDLSQQSQQSQNFRLPSHQSQNNQDLTQQTEDLSQQYQDLSQQSQQNQDLGVPSHQSQDNQDLTQQTEDLTQQFQDLSHQSQQSQDLRKSNQDLTQQTEDLTQQFQDLSQQNQDLVHRTEDLTQQSQDLGQQSEDLTQQTQDLTQQSQDLTQQNEEINQPIEPQVSTNNLERDQRNQHISQQTQDLIQQEINQNQKFHHGPGRPQKPDQNSDIGVQQTNQDLNKAENESKRLIDLLKRNQQNQNSQQHYEPVQHLPRPVYGNYNGHPVQVGTTRQIQQTPTNVQEQEITQTQYKQLPTQYAYQQSQNLRLPTQYAYQQSQSVNKPAPSTVYEAEQGPGGRTLIASPHEVNYATVEEPGKIETTRNIEPVEPQVASEVQQVGEPVPPAEPTDPDATTKKPGWWSRLGSSIKNKIG